MKKVNSTKTKRACQIKSIICHHWGIYSGSLAGDLVSRDYTAHFRFVLYAVSKACPVGVESTG